MSSAATARAHGAAPSAAGLERLMVLHEKTFPETYVLNNATLLQLTFL